jgi:N-acetylmuramoyl-L-alanine amidase
MRLRLSLLITALAGALLMVPATASAYFVHVVAPGESLFSIAATDGLTVDQLAAANGLSPTTQLVAGSTLQIPPQGSGTAVASSTATASSSGPSTGDGDNDADDVGTSTAAAAPTSSGGAYVVQPGDTLTGIASRAGLSPDSLAAANGLDVNGVLISGTVLRLSGGAAMVPVSTTVPASSSSSASGAYVVQPGDTLTAIATRAGLSMRSLAAANGLDPNRVLVSGTVLHLSGSPAVAVSSSAASSQPVGAAAEGTPTDPPYPTPERVTAPQVGSIAAQNGVPASLAAAIAWQESGFNNDLVSSADARGVMQILPGTWQWIQNTLDTGGPPLAPASAADNVRGGVLMLHSLLDATGGDAAMAAAGYYQGLPSVQQHGMYPDTQRYVQNVLSLERQFGGGG